MNNSRIWLFRGLVVVGAAIMLVSWFMPWWTMNAEQFGNDVVQIRPWGLVTDPTIGGFAILMKGSEMPAFFEPMMWAYLALCMIALLIGLFVPGKQVNVGKLRIDLAQLVRLGNFRIGLSQVLVGGVGISYIIAGIVAAVYASMRLDAMLQAPLVGRVMIDLGDPLVTFVDTMLLPGYYLIYVAGILLVALALLRGKIAGQDKSTVQSGPQGMGTLGHSRA